MCSVPVANDLSIVYVMHYSTCFTNYRISSQHGKCCSPLLRKTTTHLGQLRKSTDELGRSVQGTPKLVIKKQTRQFRSTHSVYHNRIVFTHDFILVTLSTAIFITTWFIMCTNIYIHNYYRWQGL